MAKNKYIRVCEKHWIDNEENNTTRYVLVGISWHTTVSAAKKYYSKHHETTKKELMWAEHGSPYFPLYPHIAKS